MNAKNSSTYLCSVLEVFATKCHELHSLLYHETRDIILITETWLDGNIPDGLLDREGKFHIFGLIVKNGLVVFVY